MDDESNGEMQFDESTSDDEDVLEGQDGSQSLFFPERGSGDATALAQCFSRVKRQWWQHEGRFIVI